MTMTNHKLPTTTASDREELVRQLMARASRVSEDDDEHLSTDDILAYSFERLPPAEIERIDEHLDECEACQDDVEPALEIIGPWVGATDATPALLARLAVGLRDPVWNIRLVAADMVAAIGVAAATPEILTALASALGDGQGVVRGAAVAAFGSLGAAAAVPSVLDRLAGQLRVSDAALAIAAAQAVRELGPAAKTQQIVEGLNLLRLNKSSDTGQRAAASAAASAFKAIYGASVPRSGAGGIGNKRAGAIKHHRVTPETLAALAAPLATGSEIERIAAGALIEALGSAGAELGFLRILASLLRSDEESARLAAAEALGAIGPAAAYPEILPTLAAGCRDGSADVREAVVRAIGRIGPVATSPEVLAAWQALLSDPDGTVRGSAVWTAGRLGDSAKVPDAKLWVEMLKDTVLTVRRSVGRLLHNLTKAETTASAVHREIRGMLGGISEIVRQGVEPLALHQAAGTGGIFDGKVFDDRISCRMERDTKSSDILFRFESNDTALEDALLVVEHSPGIPGKSEMLWLVLLEQEEAGKLRGRLRVRAADLPPPPVRSDFTVKIVV